MNIFNQLLVILQDAIFGADAVLSVSQQFILEQIATWMSLGVVLVPIIAMVALTVKLLKW